MAAGGQVATLASPAYLANAAANVLAAPSSGYNVIHHISIVNTGAATTFSLYLGATGGSAGGTQIGGGSFALGANAREDIYFPSGLVQSTTQFLSGVCADASRAVVTVLGTKHVSSV